MAAVGASEDSKDKDFISYFEWAQENELSKKAMATLRKEDMVSVEVSEQK